MPEWSEFWWKSITGPRNLTIAVARALHDKSNVCLIVPDDLPWRDEMRGCIETELHQLADMDGFYVEFIDVEDECAETDDVGGIFWSGMRYLQLPQDIADVKDCKSICSIIKCFLTGSFGLKG